MQKTILLAALIIAASLSIFGQTTDQQSSKTSKAEHDVKALTGELANAIVKRDTAAMERLLADDYVDISPIGAVSSRAEFVAEYKNPLPTAVKFEAVEVGASDSKVRFYGDTAVLTTRLTWRGTANGQTFNNTMATTMVAAKKNGRWQIVSTHSSPLPPPKATANPSN